MKTVCIYHNQDIDGWMSAAIVKHWFFTKSPQPNMKGVNLEDYPNKSFNSESTGNWNVLDFCGYNYGQPIPDLSEYDKVIMCDISFPESEMFKIYMQKEYGNFIWLDHHISAINTSLERDYEDTLGNRDTNFAACELTWKYFFPNETMPEIVRLLGRYDCFGHKGTDEEQKVLEFQYGARQCMTNYEEAYNQLLQEISQDELIWNPDLISNILEQGEIIYQYLCTEAKQIYKNGFEIELYSNPLNEVHPIKNTHKFICTNKERFNPINFGIDYHKDGYDGAACFHYANGKWNFSLYNDNGDVDCSIIAKQFGGGGHKGAAGFVIDNIDSLKMLIE